MSGERCPENHEMVTSVGNQRFLFTVGAEESFTFNFSKICITKFTILSIFNCTV